MRRDGTSSGRSGTDARAAIAGTGDPSNPPALLDPRPRMGQHWVPWTQEGKGTDRLPHSRNLHLGLPVMGAHAWLKWRDLISSPQTRRLKVVRMVTPRAQPVAGPRAVVRINRPALQLPQYSFVGKTDANVYAEAKARAFARAKAKR